MELLRNVAEKFDFIKRSERSGRLSTWKFECDELCREAIAPIEDGGVEKETGKLFAFDLALERAALRRRGTRATEARRKDRSGKVCFKKLEKRDRNNAMVVQRAIKIFSHSQYVFFPEKNLHLSSLFLRACKLQLFDSFIVF